MTDDELLRLWGEDGVNAFTCSLDAAPEDVIAFARAVEAAKLKDCVERVRAAFGLLAADDFTLDDVVDALRAEG